MRVTFTEAARADLNDILAYVRQHYPFVVLALEKRIRDVVARVARRPESARRVRGRAEVRVVPLLRYPYRVFYRITPDGIEIIHIHHTARHTRL
jgi:plasmid stabilization system protein ParE